MLNNDIDVPLLRAQAEIVGKAYDGKPLDDAEREILWGLWEFCHWIMDMFDMKLGGFDNPSPSSYVGYLVLNLTGNEEDYENYEDYARECVSAQEP